MRIFQLLILSIFLLSAIEAQTSSDLDSIDFEYDILDPDSQSTLLAAEKSANIDYLSFGYDIFSGNPHSTLGVDPGFKSRIFNLTYNRQSKSTDGAWDIPDSTNMARIDSCSLNFKSTEIDTMASYSDSLAIEVTVSGGISGIASFKASTDYKSAEKTLSTNNDKFIYSDANCDVYRAVTSIYDPPNLHSEFILALESLPAIYNQDEYFQFLDYFGTHAVSEIFMGARFGMMSRISQETYDKFTSQGITVTAAASFNLFGASGGVDTRTGSEKEIAKKYSSAITEKHIISVGVKPVKDGDGVAWAQQAIQSPMPLRYKLIPISEIVTAKYVRGAIPDNHINSVKTNIKTAFENYCKNYLVPQGLLANCDQPSKSYSGPPRQTKPPKINSCRWCAKKCGGEFSEDGGHLLGDQQWPKWAIDYPPGCYGNLGNQDIEKGSGVRLCCQPIDPKSQGQCRICSSCGGQFPETVGATLVGSGWDKFGSAYDSNCNGDSRPRADPDGSGLKFCCQKDPICSLCSSCGGNWQHEAGVLGADEDNKDFWRGRGPSCSGSVAKNDAKGGMKWCCKTKEISPRIDFLSLVD